MKYIRYRMIMNIILYFTIFASILFVAHISATKSVKLALSNQLPPLMNNALINAHDEEGLFQLSSEYITKELNPLTFTTATNIHLINNVFLSSLSFSSKPVNTSERIKNNLHFIEWDYPGGTIEVRFALSFSYHWLMIMLMAMVITLFLLTLEVLLPSKNNQLKKQLHNNLSRFGYDPLQVKELINFTDKNPSYLKQIKRLNKESSLTFGDLIWLLENEHLKTLVEDKFCWFIIAINQKHTVEDAMNIAEQDDSIIFDIQHQQVIIHGLKIQFPKTPLFYYFWYAKRKIEGLDGYINPLQNKPDIENGVKLAKIMESYQGHQRAINDLTTIGLKGKTLDQNRNKIKDELQKTLGSDIAKAYLFDCIRDTKTARYKYAISLPSSAITLQSNAITKPLSQ